MSGAATRTRLLAVALLSAAAVAVGCGGPTSVPPSASTSPDYGAAAVCGTVAPNPATGLPDRVENDSCPAGYVEVPGHPYRWYFLPWREDRDDVDIVYVGGSLDRGWSTSRPVNVSTVNIYNGAPRDRASAEIACGCAAPTAARVVQRSRSSSTAVAGPSSGGAAVAAPPVAEQRKATRAPSPSVTRGGLGVKDRAPAPRVSPPAGREVRVASAPKTSKTPR